MSSLQQEKEKLRRRLEKLFQKVENVQPNGNRQQSKAKIANNIKETNDRHAQKSQPYSNETIANALKPQQQLPNNSVQPQDASKHNGFFKGPDKSVKDIKKVTKSTRKKDKQGKVKLESSKDSSGIKPSEHQYLQHQQRPSNKTMNSNKHKEIKFKARRKKNKSKNQGNVESNVKQLPKKKISNFEQKLSSEDFLPSFDADNKTKFNKRKNKKATTLGYPENTSSNSSEPSAKKRKLTKNNDKKSAKLRQNSGTKTTEYDASFAHSEDVYDVHTMAGCVRGGYDDFEYEGDMENEDDNCSDKDFDDNFVQKLKKNSKAAMEMYDKKESSDSEEDYFNEINFYSDSYEDETHSDSDPNYCEYNESSSFYSEEDELNCDDFGNDMPYNFYDEDNDDDYELPKHVPEDIIIHKGTATKRDIKPEDNVSFSREHGEIEIVELENQQSVKVIKQPKGYLKEELLKLKYVEKSVNNLKNNKEESESNDSEQCPKLVPIFDEEGFQPYNSNEVEEYGNESAMDNESLHSDYTELNSDAVESLLEEDINEKYLYRHLEESDTDFDAKIWKNNFNVDVIDATGCPRLKALDKSKYDCDASFEDNDARESPSPELLENIDLKAGCSIFSTTIVDKTLFNTSKKIGKQTKTKTYEIQMPTRNEWELAPENIDVEMSTLEEESKTVTSPKLTKCAGKNLSYRTKFFNAFNSNLVIVLLKDPFYIYGTVRLTLLAGNVEVYGHTLTLNTEVEIFSPRGCSVIEISPSETKEKFPAVKNLKEILKDYKQYFALADLNTIVQLYDCDKDAVVLLKRNETRKKLVQQFKKFMNENVFPNINNINVDRSLYNSEYLLRCVINTSAQEQKCLRLPKQWQQIYITGRSRVLLVGGKSVGKSTLLRYLINRHLTPKILLIDLDIGQPEFFLPQTISCMTVEQPLLGPGFFLNLQPEISYAVGHTNIAMCAHKYIAAVRSLIDNCRTKAEYREIPWVVNTMGYNKGFGLELISVITQELCPTDLIQIQSSKEINNFDCILEPNVLSSVPRVIFADIDDGAKNVAENLNYCLHVWQSAVEQKSRYQTEWEMSAKDLRFAIFLARLSEALQGHAEWLTDIKPFSAALSDLKIINLMDNTPTASVEQLAKAVEANLVYLCHYEDDVKPLKCIGLGVVRAVDFHVQQLYLIPAVANHQLNDVNCLAIGEFPLPTSLFTNQGPRVKDIAPFVYDTAAANASKAIKQMYYRPRKFQTGNHKPLD